jgi:hypothetical protein
MKLICTYADVTVDVSWRSSPLAAATQYQTYKYEENNYIPVIHDAGHPPAVRGR